MDWNNILNTAISDSGLQEWVQSLVDKNKDEIDNIEEYVTDMVFDIIAGNDRSGYRAFKKLKKPLDKLKAARGLIAKARKERKDYNDFKKSVASVLGVVMGSAIKSLL